MSLSARIAVEPSRRIAWLQHLFPTIGLLVAATTLGARWPAHRALLLVAAVVGIVAIAGLAHRRFRDTPRRCRLTVSDRAEFDVRSDDGTIDGPCRLAESTVVWPGFWMLALQPEGQRRVRRLAFEPSTLDPVASRSLARFLTWSVRARGAGSDVRENGAG